ncbi:CUE domain-containing protein [Forsythia ovata]|uniref:CUE domain-containing protein n=1 Tax=Forsythia ovata TaxID=205694 RepID=A0ABD1WFZ8_9LAMI
MDLKNLQMTFPDISKDSLSGVLLACNFDVESAVDMLNQLELYPVDLSEKLPESLDIGDVTESVSYSESASQRGEAGASTSDDGILVIPIVADPPPKLRTKKSLAIEFHDRVYALLLCLEVVIFQQAEDDCTKAIFLDKKVRDCDGYSSSFEVVYVDD